jgi:predicted nucleotidyltransferase
MNQPASTPASATPQSDTQAALLNQLVQSARDAFGPDLRSIVLFGSAAEGTSRATSDVNLVIVLRKFTRENVDRFRNPFRAARAAIKASAMFILDSEVPAAADAFAVKFVDISRRRRVLWGDDVFAELRITREATRQRLVQMLVNLILRLRERYVLASMRDHQATQALAEMAGPLRVAAATLLELEGKNAASGKTALEQVAQSVEGGDWSDLMAQISRARRSQLLPPGVAAGLMFRLIDLATALKVRADNLK